MTLVFSRTFETGLLDPATITWDDFQHAIIGDASETSPTRKPIKKGGKQTKSGKPAPAGVDAITDFRGWAERIHKNEDDIPPEIKGIEREDRAKCRVILRGLFGTFGETGYPVVCSYVMHSG